jgi:hypothetical protein
MSGAVPLLSPLSSWCVPGQITFTILSSFISVLLKQDFMADSPAGVSCFL